MSHKKKARDTIAAVMTSKGAGAIATIAVAGGTAEEIVGEIFEQDKEKKAEFSMGRFYVGKIKDGKRTIDQVTIGCEGKESFAINCHGNRLIVTDILRLLEREKVEIVSAERFLEQAGKCRGLNTIEIEAKIAQAKAKTIEGTKIILNQVEGGLFRVIKEWSENIETEEIEVIKQRAKGILERSKLAKLIIKGAKIVLAGPANSGKSTLLNYMSGSSKSIVTGIAGTTVDYVTADCRIVNLVCEVIDTAGVDKGISNNEQGILNDEVKGNGKKVIEEAAQKKGEEISGEADLVLVVLDRNTKADNFEKQIIERISGRKILTVLNKSDLPLKMNIFELPKELRNCVTISAKTGDGVEVLNSKISELLGTIDFDTDSTVCFTERQEKKVEKIAEAKSREQIIELTAELLKGKV